MDKYLIIYHKEDNDGLFSMAIIYNYLENEVKVNPSQIDLFGTEYNELGSIGIEEEKYEDRYSHVIITDISFTPDRMVKLQKIFGNRIIWFDHHAPIIKESFINGFGDINGLRDMSHSALRNAYTYLYDPFGIDSKHKLPEYFKILSAWDSFSFEREGYELDYVRNVNVGTNIKYNLNPAEIINLVYNIIYGDYHFNHQSIIDDTEELGKIINEAKDKENETLIKISGDFTWNVNNRPACALFVQCQSNSLMFKSVPDNILNGIVFKRNKDSRWTISVYNVKIDYDKEFHCGEYLKKKYGGGGHAGAAGCQITEEEFIKMLKTKTI